MPVRREVGLLDGRGRHRVEQRGGRREECSAGRPLSVVVVVVEVVVGVLAVVVVVVVDGTVVVLVVEVVVVVVEVSGHGVVRGRQTDNGR